jgi:hypothetical protein
MNQNDQAFFFAGFIHANRDCLARRTINLKRAGARD